jgi:hypothetical protein
MTKWEETSFSWVPRLIKEPKTSRDFSTPAGGSMEASWGELAAYVEDASGTMRLTGGFRGARD